jgi:hypothetical protein
MGRISAKLSYATSSRTPYQPALERAALKAFEGRYDDVELGQEVDRATIEQEALQLIIAHQEGQHR